MPEPIVLFYLSQPFLMAIGLAVAIALAGGAVIGWPVVPLGAYLAVFFVFPQSNYGSLDVFMANPIYARGSGRLFYPALSWALLVAVAWSALGRRFAQSPPLPPSPVQRWLWLWAALLAVHLAVGLMLDVEARHILDSHGFAQVVWMLPLVMLMQMAARDEQQLHRLLQLLVWAALLKAAFGLVRWGFFGGDPSNAYQNLGRLDVKLTYFDICDALVCLLGGAAAAAMLLGPREQRGSVAWQLLCGLTVLAVLACIGLSHRRTAWGGLVLAMGYVLARASPPRWRWALLLGLFPLAVAALGLMASQRLSDQAGPARGLAGFFFDLIGSRVGPESTRLLELRLAWAAWLESPVVGLGAWGRFANAHLIPWQIHAGGTFLHSGVLHLLMKAGVVGGLLLAGLAWGYLRESRAAARQAGPAGRVWLLVSACGLLFMLPDMLFGTPVPQLRTMQLLALCLGVPALVAATRAT